MRTKNNYFEIRHNGYVLLFLVAVLFSFVIILEIIDFVEHSFKANWFMYIGLLVFCVLLSFPVLFTTLSHSNSNTKTYNHIIKHFHRYTAFFYHSGACQGICSKC